MKTDADRISGKARRFGAMYATIAAAAAITFCALGSALGGQSMVATALSVLIAGWAIFVLAYEGMVRIEGFIKSLAGNMVHEQKTRSAFLVTYLSFVLGLLLLFVGVGMYMTPVPEIHEELRQQRRSSVMPMPIAYQKPPYTGVCFYK